MSNTETTQQLAPYQTAIKKSEKRFTEIAREHVDFRKESIFAMQQLIKNEYAMGIANANPQSVHLAMINVASTGLTLNPAHGYAYLVPRDSQILLDISYKGLIKIATDTGAVVWVRADLVYANDTFTYRGPAREPDHKADPFSKDRGEVIGGYCIAKTKDGDVLTEVMPVAELEKIRNASTAWTRGKEGRKGPWEGWFDQMAKKSVIKRASKTWPYSEQSSRLMEAIEVANVGEGGYDLDNAAPPRLTIEDQRKQRHDEALEQYESSVDIIKGKIADWDETEDEDALYTVAEVWNELPQKAQVDLWLAPTKGGIWTTHERDVLKTKLPRQETAE